MICFDERGRFGFCSPSPECPAACKGEASPEKVKERDAMNRKEELSVLKERARILEARLNQLTQRIREVEHTGPRATAFQAVVDSEKCVGCGLCEETCPLSAISVEETARVDPIRCIGCGRCADECPQGAISMEAAVMGGRLRGVGKGGYRFRKTRPQIYGKAIRRAPRF
jgi:ferredoxin